MRSKLLVLLLVVITANALFGQKKSNSPNPKFAPKITANLPSAISTGRNQRLEQREQATKSIVILKNSARLLPLRRLDTLKVLTVSIGMGNQDPFAGFADRYVKSDHLSWPTLNHPEISNRSLPKNPDYNLVIVAMKEQVPGVPIGETANSTGVVPTDSKGKTMFKKENQMLNELAEGRKMVLVLFGSPAFLSHWSDYSNASSLVISDKADYDRLDLSVQAIFGAVNSTGRLTFDAGSHKKGDGIQLPAINRLSYVLPEELGMDSLRLAAKMDSLVEIGLKARAFPGCQMLLAKNGKVFYQKSYGFHTYDQERVVHTDDLYDLASVTKILAPLPLLMMLADQNKFLVGRKMSDYWPDWKSSNKEGILVSDLLTHQARLRPGITIWPKLVDARRGFNADYCSPWQKQGYGLRISSGLYLIDSFRDSVYKAIRNSPLLKSKRYVYSDLGFVILPGVIEKLTGEFYSKYLDEKLYSRLGTSTLMYLPALQVPLDRIVPTERDQLFRHELLHGFVHDETAAVMGGISGNAGLFGSAGDVAKVMQLYLQDGVYGDETYISSGTLKTWTSSHQQKISNRRGYGFDKPAIQTNLHTGKERYPSSSVSEQSFGHSGYTGTFVWADPSNGLLFVFLSNRVYPDRENHKINRLKLRPLLLENFFRIAGPVVSTK